MENKEVLPLGSVVVLKEGIQKLLIVGRGVIYNDTESNSERFADYVGVLYPTGLDPEATVFFNLKILMRYYLKDIQIRMKKDLLKYIKSGKRIPF